MYACSILSGWQTSTTAHIWLDNIAEFEPCSILSGWQTSTTEQPQIIMLITRPLQYPQRMADLYTRTGCPFTPMNSALAVSSADGRPLHHRKPTSGRIHRTCLAVSSADGRPLQPGDFNCLR